MDLGISNHIALITGGGRGIGAAVSRNLAREGATIVIWDRDEAPANELAESIRREGGNASVQIRTVESSTGVKEGVHAIIAEFGRIDILVNNAGFSHLGPITELTDDQWASVLGVHMTGAFNMVREVAPFMKKQNYGRIINMSSLANLGAANMACYSAVKAGLLGFTRALAVEFGAHNITVNAVAPSLIHTERLKASSVFRELSELSLRGQSIKRDGMPEDVANAIAFLASRNSGFITGEAIYVTGGIYQLW